MLYENWLCTRLYRRAENGPADQCPGGRGCERIYRETTSGAAKSRPELERCLVELRKNDTLVVWSLDRFGRSLKDLVSKMEMLEERGVDFVSLTEGIETTTAQGQLTFSSSETTALFVFLRLFRVFPTARSLNHSCVL